jgi:hypothetical protein
MKENEIVASDLQRSGYTQRLICSEKGKFYKRLNDVRRPFEPQVAMCGLSSQKRETINQQKLSACDMERTF